MADTIKIGGELESMATGNVVAAASAIKDKAKNKYQGEINAEVDIHLESLDNKTDNTDADLESLENRVHSVEELAEISVGGGDIQIANTGEDIQPGSGKVATANALADAYGSYVENPEFVYVKTDTENKILWGIRTDGDIFYGAGVPSQVVNYINEKIAELSLDEYEDIVAFLNDLEKGDKTLQDLLDEKVDKEEGKSLIDEEYANGVHCIENPEFVEVKLDADDRILEATMLDGTKLLPAGYEIGGNVVKTISNPEYLAAWLDITNHILFALKVDGDVIFGCGVPHQIKEHVSEIIKPFEELFHYDDSPEFIDVKLDAKNKVLEGIKIDGTKVFGGDVKVLGSIDINGVTYKVVSNPEWLKVVVDAEYRVICGIKTDGRFVICMADFLDDIDAIKTRLKELDAYSVTENPEFLEVELDADDKVLGGRKVDGTKFENNDVELNGNATVGGSLKVNGVVINNIEDPEGRLEIETDSKDKIISYRKDDGTLVENAGIETTNTTTDSLSAKEVNIEGGNATLDSLELTEQGMTEFQQALKAAGFQPGGGGDASDEKLVSFPFPVKASKINFIVARPITEECLNPLTGEDEQSGYMEYYDYYGNYFKKPCIINTQGQTSQRNRKKNIGLDIDDGSEISFGDWVPQDSFHIKAHPNDITGTRLVSAYRFAEKVYQVIGGRPFDAINDDSSITYSGSTGNIYADFKNNVLCHPDGFAVEVYFNGEWWGLGMLQLKKNRKNYGMDKKDYESVLLDMTETLNYFWGGKETIGWTVNGMMDIKNPKTLIAMDGSEWEEGKELIDSTSPNYDSSNKDHKNTAKTKKVIEDMADSYNTVLALESELDNNAAAKAKFEELYDKDACEAVYIINCLLKNVDSIKKNTLWLKYKTGKIAPAPYDLDGTYGGNVTGLSVSAPSGGLWDGAYATSAWPLSFIWKYYRDEIIQKYSFLRSSKVISVDTFKELFNELYIQQSFSSIEREIDKWTPVPYRDAGTLNSAYWTIGTHGNENTWTQWDKDTEYQVNDCVFVVGDSNVNAEAIKGERLYGVKYTCIAPNQNQCPVDIIYDNYPYTGGMYDSVKRQLKWIELQIARCDYKLGYSE